ncbi:MAG: hypothetical protein CL678_12825 [Bdellovibrionaceae bacterium]|nr:hypothetical protein [Pseudobdellovibrionaceae bacterium]|tara:strand:+ start:12929 stop:13714 length:786 start_codon:yes stop_codon:yes gene_type:complete
MALILFLFFNQISFASDYLINNDTCIAIPIENHKIQKQKKTTLSEVGEVKSSQRYKGSKKYLTIYTTSGKYITKRACISKEQSLASPLHWGLHFSLQGIQEPLELVHSSGTAYDITASYIGICAGAKLDWRFSTWGLLSVPACILGSLSEASYESFDVLTAPIIYGSKRAVVFGLEVNPTFYWSPLNPNIQFGVKTPLGWRKGTWTQPADTNYQISPSGSLLWGIMLSSRIIFSKASVGIDSGFIRDFKSLSWILSTEIPL